MDRRQTRLLIDTVFLGVVGALSAQCFDLLLWLAQYLFLNQLAGYQPPGPASGGGGLHEVIGAGGLWLVPAATTVGGLISGALVFGLAPEAEGHGTDTAVRAYHTTAGVIRSRVAPVKMVASAITIGSGGAAGREGPTALISAGIGSLYATLTRRPEDERRLLLLIGMAAGLSAIFRSPIGAAIFTIEVLYSEMEFETRALLYTLLGSIVAYAINGVFVGWQPLFDVPADLGIVNVVDYAWYVCLGTLAGCIGAVLPEVFYGVRDLFHAAPLPQWLKPAVGGLGVGLLALALPQVLGGGYGWIQQVIDGHLAVALLVLLIVGKMLAFALTVASGGSGGVFAPALFVGAMLGGALAPLFDQPPAAFVVVGMAAVFGAAARVPIAALLMVTEMTGGYRMLVPAALAVTISYFVQVTLSDRLRYKSLYEGQVPLPSDSPAHHAEQLRVALGLLDRQHVPLSESVGHLKLIPFLKLGIPVDLPDGKRLIIGKLRPESPCVGTTIRSGCLFGSHADAEIVAIVRKPHLFIPHPNTILHAGDQLIVLGSVRLSAQLAPHLVEATSSEAREGGRRTFRRRAGRHGTP